ncbi:diguanylate cyclase (GGDEF)-like protein [Duganella sp. 1224]|uniref:putative bifunctional diguanylate cyclase/phosphodiesterase n=1 Tax=Duganella sp. 1224 TaxID=2587052 RepID=UPI0015CB80EE|nr:EAL domain-containing protein [Duganella sp. 1224]NYE60265.1 diguanylate cyclase (GGDEF)-like protein [Duganella sp. 1224]
MKSHARPPQPQFVSYLWACSGTLLLVAVAFMFYVWTEKRIDQANDVRYASHNLVEELRQSSDDLTRMARTYVATGEPQYRKNYNDIVDIREGRAPRPRNYENVYWDLVQPNGVRPRASDAPAPLMQLMREAHFSPEELALLATAKNESDKLINLEVAAMDLRANGGSVEQATAMLHDAAYHRTKADIMRPIGAVNDSVDRRTRALVEETALDANLARSAFMFSALMLVLLVWRAKRRLDAALGCSVDQLQAGMEKLGRGDFSDPLTVNDNARDSVWGWLAHTQQGLARLDRERNEALERIQRISRLYSALSQCNQAIVRSHSEAELFERICRDVVNYGGMAMAWIGIIDKEHGRINVAASFGGGVEYLDQLEVSLDPNTPEGRGPIGLSYHSGQPYWCQDYQHAPETAYWHAHGARYGWASSAAVPLRRDGEIIGFFAPYSSDVNAFDPEVRELLLEMTLDIEFALKNFDREAVRQQADQRVQYLAHYDLLTGLPNRSQLHERARHLLEQARIHRTPMALLMMDLDHFKDINDTLGHTVGDALLSELALRLTGCLRETDLVARLGGDEFIFVLPNAGGSEASDVARKLLNVTGQAHTVGAHDLKVSASIGIAMYPDDGWDVETLLQRADAAMYQVKRAGRHDFRFFTAAMQQRAARHLQLVNALRYALEREQLHVVYQPQVSLKTGQIVGAEALLRWNTPELGAVSPAEFIPAAEDSGLIVAIGDWVLRQAVRQARAWLDDGLPPLVMAVNLSAIQFRTADLPSHVAQVLYEEGLPPEYLELELTEGVAVQDPQGAIATMNQLHDRGIRMSIDDFGTGFSSLSHLKKFKVYKLKIDQSFVRDISTDSEDKAIVSAIINMARSLGLTTIAEGVETVEQLEFLREQDCDEMQGYHFSKPLAADAFRKLLQHEKR